MGFFLFPCQWDFRIGWYKDRFLGALKKKQKSGFLRWGLWLWWRRLHPPPLPASRIPTRQIYDHRAQVGPWQIICYFTCAIYFVGNAINHFHRGRKKRVRCLLRRLPLPQITAAFHSPSRPPGCCWQTNAAVRSWYPPLAVHWGN